MPARPKSRRKPKYAKYNGKFNHPDTNKFMKLVPEERKMRLPNTAASIIDRVGIVHELTRDSWSRPLSERLVPKAETPGDRALFRPKMTVAALERFLHDEANGAKPNNPELRQFLEQHGHRKVFVGRDGKLTTTNKPGIIHRMDAKAILGKKSLSKSALQRYAKLMGKHGKLLGHGEYERIPGGWRGP